MTNPTRGESSKAGWLLRTFGAGELREQLERASQELAARDALLRQREQEICRLQLLAEQHAVAAVAAQQGEAGATAALEQRERAMAAHVEQLAECTRRAERAEAQREAEEAKAKRHEKIAATALQRADERSAELEAERRKLAQSEAKYAQLTRQKEALAQQLQEREQRWAASEQALEAVRGELDSAQWALAALQASNATLEASQTRAQTELGEQLATIAQLQRAMQDQGAELERRALELARLEQVRAAQAARLEEGGVLVRRLAALSALSLDAVLGCELHLGVELGFAALERSSPVVPPGERGEAPLLAEQVRGHLVALGLAEDFRLEPCGEALKGHLRLCADHPVADGAPLARWLAAYALCCVNWLSRGSQRLVAVSGGPRDYELSTAPERRRSRAAAVSPASRAS